MRSASNCQKLHRYLLPVALICLLAVLVSFSGCLTGLPGLSGFSLVQGSGSSTGTANPPAYDTSQAQTTQSPATGTAGGSCRQGLTSCSGNCVDTTVDIGNCGGCGMVCPSNAQCNKGACYCKDGYEATAEGTCIPVTAPAAGTVNTGQNQQFSCAHYPGTTACNDGYCWYLTEDDHCGSCDNACAIDQTCTNGQCVGITGQTGGSSTGQTVCNGQNVDLMTDNVNCGACGNVCDGCKPCVQGSCQYQVGVCDYCTQNSDCVGDRFPTTGFAQNHFTWVCKYNGETNSCIVDCAPSYKACSPLVCTNIQTDEENCGSCGHTCSAGQICLLGHCGTDPSLQTCVYPDSLCNGNCVNLQTDEGNCGSCGHTCGSTQICLAGKCGINPALLARTVCAYPLTSCNGNCVNTQSDTNNCGSCGTKCPTGGSCSNGVCACPTGYINSNGVCSKLQVGVTLSSYKRIVSGL